MLASVAPEAQAALATAAGAVVVAVLGATQSWSGKRAARRAETTASETADKIGNPNGQGDLVAMVTHVQQSLDELRPTVVAVQQGMSTVVAGQAGQDNRIARLEAGHHELVTRLSAVEARTAGCPARAETPPPPAAQPKETPS